MIVLGIILAYILAYYIWLLFMFEPRNWNIRRNWHMIMFVIPFYAILKRGIERISYLYSRYKKLK